MPMVRIPLTQPLQSRTASTGKDSRSVNCYFERVDANNRDNIKRPGLLNATITPAMTAGQAQGMYTSDSGYLRVVLNNQAYRIDSSFNSITSGTLTGAVHNVYFAESANNAYLFMHNGTNGYVATGDGSFVQIAVGGIYEVSILTGGAGYVTPTCTFSAPPAGVTATGTVNITGGVVISITITNYGSGYVTAPTCTINPVGGGAGATALVSLNGFPTGAGAIVDGAIYLDGYTVIATKLGQIFNSDSEDPRLWNPLNTIAIESDPDYVIAIVKHFNFIVAFGEWSTEFFYNAANAEGSPFLRQDSYKNEIGCADGNSVVQFQQSVLYVGKSKTHGKSVYRLLDGFSPASVSTQYIEKYLNADINTDIQSFCFRIAGHTLYVMTLPNLDKTFVYDVDQNIWYEWTSYYSAAEHAFRVWTATEFTTGTYGIDATNGLLYLIDPNTYTDNSQPIYWRVVTNNLDAGTRHRKFFESGEVIGDKIAGTMSINFSADDYNNFSTVRTVDLNSPRSILWQLGQSRYRAYQFLSTSSVPLRLSSFELGVRGGEQDADPQLSNGPQ